MATVVLASAGAPFGLASVGAAVGMAIDQKFVFPKLFPPEPIEGQRMGDLPLTSAVEGTPMNWPRGPENHVGGVIIWQGKLVEFFVDIEQSSGGGCGGSEQKVVERKYFYLISLAVAVAESEINDVKKIWADGKLLYDDNTNRQVSDNQISATTDYYVKHTGPGVPGITYYYFILQSPTTSGPAPDLTIFKSGAKCTVSGFSNPSNNGTWSTVRSWQDAATGDTFLQLVRPHIPFIPEPAGNTITIQQTVPAFRSDRVQDITIYKGLDAQPPDPYMQSILGITDCPNYQGIAYVVFKNLFLNEYGVRIPTLTFLVEQAVTKTLEDGVADVLARSSLDPAYYDTTSLY